MTEFILTDRCKIPCAGSAEDCPLAEVLQRLDPIAEITTAQVELMQQLTRTCIEAAKGVSTAAQVAPDTLIITRSM